MKNSRIGALMTKSSLTALLLFAPLLLAAAPALVMAQDEPPDGGDSFLEEEFDDLWEDEEVVTVYDPLEPFNRAMFYFNDKLYFYALKPAARGYSFVVPKAGRVAVRRFFSNVTTPVRFSNALLQFKLKAAGIELSRFVINSTVGLAGFMDPARDRWQLYKQREDFGQTLGFYGAGPGIYITWPIFGPSNIRDTIGLAGDSFLDPVNYLPTSTLVKLGVHTYDNVNETSLEIGLYEDVKRDALDPYIFIRNAYEQHRRSRIAE